MQREISETDGSSVALHEMIEKIVEQIRKNHSFLLLAHRNVDGDAYGSTIALTLLLKKLGKTVEVVNELPIAPAYHFLGHHDRVENQITNHRPDVMIVCDCAEPKLCGKIYEEYGDIFDHSFIIDIDHHPGNIHFGAINLVDTGASSTCELITEIILSTPDFATLMDRDIATMLLYGIFRDTNCYKNGIRPRTFELTARLVEYGAEYSTMVFQTFKQEPLNYLALYGHALNNAITLNWGKIVGVSISQADFQKYGIREYELGPQFINEILSSIQGADYVFLMKETEAGERKLSFRIRNAGFDVSKIAVLLGGGGHKGSAAAYTHRPVDEILQIIEETDISE